MQLWLGEKAQGAKASAKKKILSYFQYIDDIVILKMKARLQRRKSFSYFQYMYDIVIVKMKARLQVHH